MKKLEFAELVLGLGLVPYFLAMFPTLSFGMEIYILSHYMLEACGLLFHFYFYSDYITFKKTA